ncbi:helix-turn-helix domain-containing protein [Paraburkholderia sp. J12]|uniref:helix-turn-helix domain-containing protein n=1 Tax=Paraburkholderia sp. J12 TaxID=2805432 RepID=UPI002ABE42E8|nr:helix-turn-helix domain-containing protein [Paraburkholderia sp. J12]
MTAASPNDPAVNPAAQTCPWLRSVVSHDADEQASTLMGWRQIYDQLTAGRFVGELAEIRLDDMRVFRESTSQSLRQTCEVPENTCWFGIPLDRDRAGRIQSSVIGKDALAWRPSGVQFELMTPPDYEIYGIVATHDALRRYAENVAHTALSDALPYAEVVVIGDERREQLCTALHAVLEESAQGQGSLSPSVRSNLQSSLFTLLFDSGALHSDKTPTTIPSGPRRQWIVSAAREYVLANRDRPVGVPELCEVLHVSRRTLQYCFQDVCGIAPNHYLRAIRLNGARRDLRRAQHDEKSVQDVAADWGFWHLSQFALDYRKLFGVRPSDTLKSAIGEDYDLS